MSKKSDAVTNINHRRELIKLINNLSYKYGAWKVFEDFLAMSAMSISNAVDWNQKEKREAEYMEIVGRYERHDVDAFPQMMDHLVGELECHTESLQDVLGQVFHELELHNKYKGQFFTPQHICDFMGMISLHENDPDISKKGYIAMVEPCCGSGAMILGFANAMTKNGYSYNQQMVARAIDIDIKCVYMCYLQLSLYGIPAVIIHGNSFAYEEWSRWHTPVFMLDEWPMRLMAADNPPQNQFYFVFEPESRHDVQEMQLSLF